MRLRFLALVTAVSSIATVGTASADPEPSVVERPCTVERLPELDQATYSEVYAGDPSGRWLVGTVWTEDGATHAVAWRDGKLREPEVPVGPATFEGVTRSGDIAGWAPGEDGATAFALIDDEYVALASPEGARHTYAGAINGDRIAGHAELLSGPSVPVVWMRSNPADPIVLELPPGYSGFVVGMTPSGEVLVDAFDPSFVGAAFVFSPTLERRELVAPPEIEQPFHLSAAARGYAAAWVESGVQVLRFDLETGVATVLDAPVLVGSVNADGTLGGNRHDTQGPALVRGDSTKDLPTVAPYSYGTVTAISSSGALAGTSEAPGGTFAAVTWTCG